MARKRRFIAPNNPTAQAKQLWRYVYGEPWPKGWKVEWVRSFPYHDRRIGQCGYGRKLISLHYRAHAKPIEQDYHENRRIYVGGHSETGPEILAYTVKQKLLTYSVMHTLIHEFIHLRHRGLKHGKEFERLITWGMTRLGLKADCYV